MIPAAARASSTSYTGPEYNVGHRDRKREYDPELLVQGITLTPASTTTPVNSKRAASSTTRAPTATATAAATTCAYVGNTSVPRTVGGILFNALNRIFCCFILLFMLVAEAPPPFKAVERFWAYAFPPFGEHFSTGVLGLTQIFIGCTALTLPSVDLSTHEQPELTIGLRISGFPQVAGWFLFILGCLNMLFGLAFGSSIKSIRSVLSTPTAPSGLRAMRLAQQRQEGGGGAGAYREHHDPEQADESNGRQPKKYAGKRGIQISAPIISSPMVQVPEPPLYR